MGHFSILLSGQFEGLAKSLADTQPAVDVAWRTDLRSTLEHVRAHPGLAWSCFSSLSRPLPGAGLTPLRGDDGSVPGYSVDMVPESRRLAPNAVIRIATAQFALGDQQPKFAIDNNVEVVPFPLSADYVLGKLRDTQGN